MSNHSDSRGVGWGLAALVGDQRWLQFLGALEPLAEDAERRITAYEAYLTVHPHAPPPVIPQDAFRVWGLIEDLERDAGGWPQSLRVAVLGGGDARLATANIAKARKVHAVVSKMLAQGFPVERRERPGKRRATAADESAAKLLQYVVARSAQLGFSFLQITERQRGRTSDETRPIREARARIVAELIDDRRATAEQIGPLFDVTRQAVELLRDQGRHLRWRKRLRRFEVRAEEPLTDAAAELRARRRAADEFPYLSAREALIAGRLVELHGGDDQEASLYIVELESEPKQRQRKGGRQRHG